MEVQAGDQVQFATRITGAIPGEQARLRIVVEKGPADALRVESGLVGARPTAEVTLRADEEVRLQNFRYSCVFPGGFCPVVAEQDGARATFTLAVPGPDTPVTLTAEVASADD